MIINKLLDENRQWIDETWEKMVIKLRRNSVLNKDKLPKVTVDGVYDDHSDPKQIEDWTNGFWPGIMWLMYAATKEECFRETAENGERALDMALEDYQCLDHDSGFIWHISSGANYRLTGNEKSKNRNLHAAAGLASRYNLMTKTLKAWNGDEINEGFVIIDSMMNIPLLYWAAKENNNIAFKQMAMSHADTTIENHIRPDGSVYHIMDYDIHTGECKGPAFTTQGYDPENSSWTRGQGWAIYGFVLSYIHTGEQRYLDTAKRVAHYFIAAACSNNYVVKLDFRAPEEPDYMDSSAAAIAACGLIEIARVVPEFEKKLYMDAALKLMKVLCETQCDFSQEEQSILQNSSAAYSTGIHRPWIYGEYFFVEAMCKLKGVDVLFW